MTTLLTLAFSSENIFRDVESLSDSALDDLPFGVIGFDESDLVSRYNKFESECAGLAAERVLGQNLFKVVAPCMNNFMVAQRFEDSRDNQSVLDATIDYVLTLRMRPIKVKLRLLAMPDAAVRYVLVQRII